LDHIPELVGEIEQLRAVLQAAGAVGRWSTVPLLTHSPNKDWPQQERPLIDLP